MHLADTSLLSAEMRVEYRPPALLPSARSDDERDHSNQ